MTSLSPMEATRLANREAAQQGAGERYVAVLATFAAANKDHSEVLKLNSAALTAESRQRLERAKAALAVARAAVINASWQGKLSKVENLSHAVTVLLDGIVADARRQAP
ncbi:hypothetical protein AB4Z27_04345 [Cupriavidus sp. KB_39]|uniref:hypothetical protein n=1 Tax=Cupriavidus sp. KB_39 TaxID=3233036 RepID=UPI003F8E29A8